MKQLYTLPLFFVISFAYAQIGIGTTNPQSDLHVVGDILVQDTFKIGNLNTVTALDEGFKLLTRTTDSSPVVGEITVLDVDALQVAPVNTIDYHFTNISLDNLTDVDLQYDTSKYIVAITNFRYVGDAIQKAPTSTTKSIGHFVVRAFESAGTWHLEIRNRDLDLNSGTESIDYYVTITVYDRSYFRHLPTITTNLGGSNSGTASSTPVLY